MSEISALLDHVVINVHAALDESAATYRQLGFTLTERGHHSLGSSNHLAMFGTDYLELLGYEPGREALRPPGFWSQPPGLTGLVFKPPAHGEMESLLAECGVAALPGNDFSRPVNLPSGPAIAKFRTTALAPDEAPYGRVYFCRHDTPELIWRREWQQHANGVDAVAAFTIATPDPIATAAVYRKMFGTGAMRSVSGGFALVTQDGAWVECLSWEAAAARYAGAILPQEPGVRMVGLALRSQRGAALPGVATLAGPGGAVIVPAAAAHGVALAFVTAMPE